MSLRALLLWSMLAMGLDIGIARITYGIVLPALARDLGLDYVAAGLLSSVNLAAYLAGTLAGPALGRRFGMCSLARWGHLAFAVGALLCAGATEALALGIGRALMGFGAGIGLLALFVLVFAAMHPGRRSSASALVWSGIGFAIVLTGAAAPVLLQPGGWWRLSLALPALAGVAVGIAVGREVVPEPGAGRPILPVASAGRAKLLPYGPLAGAYFMFGVGYITYSTFAGAKLAAAAAGPGMVALSWAALGVASIAGSALTAAFLSRPALRHLALAAALFAGGLGAAAVGTGGAVLSVAGPLLVGLGMASTPAIVTAYARERSSDIDYPRVFSFATTWLGIGQLIGPTVAGGLAERFGSEAVMAFSTAAYLSGAALAGLDAAASGRRLPHER